MQIVVVDASRVVLEVIAGLLKPCGHVLHLFTDTALGLDCIRANPQIRALITSLDVTPLSGLELCRATQFQIDADHRSRSL